jgi:Fe-S oxidoreductase
LITASGCGTMIKDYGYLLRNDSAYAAMAARVSAIAKDVAEFLDTLDLPELGIIGVDMIGEIRRAYFEQHWTPGGEAAAPRPHYH